MPNSYSSCQNAKSRLSPQRTISILLRTAHLTAMAVFFGGVVFTESLSSIHAWRIAAVLSGLGLLASEIIESRPWNRPWAWPHQVRGAMVFLHIALYGMIVIAPRQAVLLLTLSLIVGSIGSHLPRIIRKWSLLHGRTME